MPNSSLHVTYKAADPADDAARDPVILPLRLRIVQEPIPDTAKQAELGDLAPMWSKAIQGKSAYEYIADTCPYATVSEGMVTVTLKFWVYPNSMDMPYRLTTGFGTLSPGQRMTQPRSMDVLLSDAEIMRPEEVITGEIYKQMPYFNREGGEINPTIKLHPDGLITSSEPVTTALRLNGVVNLYEHVLTMKLVKEVGEPGARIGYSITNLTNHVTAEWIDENGKAQKETVDVEIPPCVEQLLEVCDEDPPGSENSVDDKEDRLIVYYNTCTGEILDERIIEGDANE